MTPIAVAGGPAELIPNESNLRFASLPGEVEMRFRYGPTVFAGGAIYRVPMAPARLTAVISETDEGFVAESPEVGSLGYGQDPESAFADLQDAVRDHLTILAEKQPPLAPSVAHHARYLPLLTTPKASWFAAIRNPAHSPAANVE